jgi:hypothetical protein
MLRSVASSRNSRNHWRSGTRATQHWRSSAVVVVVFCTAAPDGWRRGSADDTVRAQRRDRGLLENITAKHESETYLCGNTRICLKFQTLICLFSARFPCIFLSPIGAPPVRRKTRVDRRVKILLVFFPPEKARLQENTGKGCFSSSSFFRISCEYAPGTFNVETVEYHLK